jgi:outer membrane murein-binding lipoprotein Lpp
VTRYAQIPVLPLPTTSTSSTTTTTAPTTDTTVTPTTFAPPVPADTVPFSVPEPGFTVPADPSATSSTTTTTASVRPTPTVQRGSVADALPGAYALGFGAVLLVAAVLVGAASRARQGGSSMLDPRRRWRLLTGVACLAFAGLIGLVGWLKLSDEPAVNRQIPYLASAGMALVVFAAIGGSLLVADQLRSDAERIDELEDAVRRLSATLEPIVESPPRTRRQARS